MQIDDYAAARIVALTMELYERLYHQDKTPNALQTFDIIEDVLLKAFDLGQAAKDTDK